MARTYKTTGTTYPAMYRGQFNLVAGLLKENKAPKKAVRSFGNAFSHTNPRFSMGKFFKASYYGGKNKQKAVMTAFNMKKEIYQFLTIKGKTYLKGGVNYGYQKLKLR